MTTSLNEVCNVILNNPKPLVFLDTCTILDVINALHMDSLPDDYIELAVRLARLHQNNDLLLVTALNVKEEYDDNIDTVVKTAETKIKQIARHLKVMHSLHDSIVGTLVIPPDFNSFSLPSHAKNITNKILDECHIVERLDEYTRRAGDRLRGNIAPARQGGREFKDCEIIECFFDVSKKLRDAGFNESIVFVTSNTNDYGKAGKLRSPLDESFEELRAEYANHINHVLRICGY